MGTFVEVAILDGSGSGSGAADAFAAAFAAVARVDATMSFHDPASDLSRLNARASQGSVVVDAWTHDVLAIAHDLFVRSAGRFDCTIASTLVDDGLLPRHAARGHDRSAAAATQADVALLSGQRVRFRRPLALDLGGIAKGYAVDRAIDALRAHGVRRAVVNAGGDLRVLGEVAVPIHVRADDDAAPRPVGLLADGAFATSACFDPTRPTRQSPSALVRPHDRTRLSTGRRYSVIAPSCVVADALTKVAALSPRVENDACLASFGATALVH